MGPAVSRTWAVKVHPHQMSRALASIGRLVGRPIVGLRDSALACGCEYLLARHVGGGWLRCSSPTGAPSARRGVVVAVLFALGVLAALASIGVFFVPALIALIAAATTDEDAPTPASRQRPT